jgi:hypothetical protein
MEVSETLQRFYDEVLAKKKELQNVCGQFIALHTDQWKKDTICFLPDKDRILFCKYLPYCEEESGEFWFITSFKRVFQQEGDWAIKMSINRDPDLDEITVFIKQDEKWYSSSEEMDEGALSVFETILKRNTDKFVDSFVAAI